MKSWIGIFVGLVAPVPAPLVGASSVAAALPQAAAPRATSSTLSNVLGSPATWLLNEYVPNQVDIWRTPATETCAAGQGHLTFNAAVATQDDMNRFWAMVTTAKATNRQITIWHDSTTCYISSFNIV